MDFNTFFKKVRVASTADRNEKFVREKFSHFGRTFNYRTFYVYGNQIEKTINSKQTDPNQINEKSKGTFQLIPPQDVEEEKSLSHSLNDSLDKVDISYKKSQEMLRNETSLQELRMIDDTLGNKQRPDIVSNHNNKNLYGDHEFINIQQISCTKT